MTYKGGVSSYSKMRREITNLCSDRGSTVSMMFDLYGIPADTPGFHEGVDVDELEAAILEDIGMSNFIPYLSRHEFESLLFSDVSSFQQFFEYRLVERLEKIRQSFSTPEDINTSPSTAPSKRIPSAIPGYIKTTDGIAIAERIGISRMMDECPHFKVWVDKLASIR